MSFKLNLFAKHLAAKESLTFKFFSVEIYANQCYAVSSICGEDLTTDLQTTS